MNALRERWKIAGVAAGVVCVVAGSATAYAYAPDHAGGVSGVNVSSVNAHDVSASLAASKSARLRIAADDAVTRIAAITTRIEDKVAALGGPSTLTPREAEHLRFKLHVIHLLTEKAGDLAAAGTTGAAALQTRLTALHSRIASILANAAVVKPFVDSIAKTTSGDTTDFAAFDPSRHHCDGHRDFYGHERRDGDFHR